MPDIAKETARDLFHGHTSVGTTRVKLSNLNFPLLKGVLLRAPGGDDPSGNTDPIWVGGSAVTADSNPTGGIPIVPGASIFIPVESVDLLWIVSTASSQDIAWLGV